MKKELNYLVIGAGGTGGCIAAYLTRGGKHTVVIARGAHLEAMKKQRLEIRKPHEQWTAPVHAMTEQEYLECGGKADIIFVCVKGYSLDSVYDCIRRASHKETVVIPILNIYGTGEQMQRRLPELTVLNGCIYVAAAIEKPGVIRQNGDIFRIVYGRLDGDVTSPVLKQVEQDLRDSGITPIFTDQVQRDTLQKFSFVSPMAAAGAYGDWSAGDYKQDGEARALFIRCVKEIDALACAMGIPFPVDIVKTNMTIMNGLDDECTASLQKDLKKGGMTEADGLISEVVRMGERFGVETPAYRMIAEKICGFRG